jgi:hypothetical protein
MRDILGVTFVQNMREAANPTAGICSIIETTEKKGE